MSRSKRVFKLFQSLIGVLSIGMVFTSFALNAYADNGASGSDNTATNKCKTTTGNSTWCGAYGVSWRRYPVSNTTANSTAAKRCKDEEVDYYYLLAYEQVDVKDGKVIKYHNKQGFNPGVQVNQVNIPGDKDASGDYVFLTNSSSSSLSNLYAWATIQDLFAQAEEAGVTDTKWENTSWFCYVEEDLKEGTVYATSTVSSSKVSGSRTSDEDGFLRVYATTYEAEFPVHFSHDLHYGSDIDTDKKNKYKKVDIKINWQVSTGDKTTETDNPTAKTWGGEDGFSAKKQKNDKTNISPSDHTIKLNVGDTKTVCSTISYKHKHFEFSMRKLEKQSGNEWSAACVTVTRAEKPASPTDEFWGNSSVEVSDSNTSLGYAIDKQTSEVDKSVGLKVSVDSDNLTFTLSHNMGFWVANNNNNIWRKWDDCATRYTDENGNVYCVAGYVHVGTATNLTYEESSSSSGDTSYTLTNIAGANDSTYKAGTDADNANTDATVSSNMYQISNMQPGHTYTVCHKLKYTSKTFSTPMWESLKWAGSTVLWDTYFDYTIVFDKWNYGNPGPNGDTGETESCIEITRPKSPPQGGGGPDPSGPRISGNNKNDVLFAGEAANVGWKVSADSVPTRRVLDYKAVGFVVNDNVSKTTAEGLKSSTETRSSSEPCTLFGSKVTLLGYGCTEFTDYGVEENSDGLVGTEKKTVPEQEDKRHFATDIVVPDEVGAKYCISYGFKWGYWWGVVKSDVGSLGSATPAWNHVANKDYWTNYGATCSTIAKKPNLAVWNGSIFSGGSINGSTSPRHNNAANGQPTAKSSSSGRTTYGSWAENLVAAVGDVTKLASAGAYGGGIAGLWEGTNGNYWEMAWQTITNASLANGSKQLGNSGISYNSSYITRLGAYFKNYADKSHETDITYAGEKDIDGTRILYFNPGGDNGTLEITGDVILRDTKNDGTAYKSIYELPQVVIYVDGSVKISNAVSRIDAWIIATGDVGELNTCSGWNDNTTQTRSANYGSNVGCDRQLQINGPIVANSVVLRRTYGADPSTGSSKNSSSEIFNLSALAYLWSYAQAGNYNSSYTETYTRELAPRY